jgi:hypothetical protein
MAEPAAFGIDEIHDNCKRGYVADKVLGAGEQGIAYEVTRNDKGVNARARLVLKVSSLVGENAAKTTEKLVAWKNEAHISYTLGQAGIGPKIYKAWTCDKEGLKGYIIMERMISDLRGYKESSEKIVYPDGTKEYIEHINRVPEDIQRDFLSGLESMIDMGFIHMDNHPGNLGIVISGGREKGILFDFGFTQKRADLVHPDAKRMALGFSVAQIIEQMPLAERQTNFLFKILVAIEQKKYVWGSGSVPATVNLEEFAAKYTSASSRLRYINAEAVPAGVPKDIYVGFRLYCYLLMLDRQPMFSRKTNYGKVYDIRQGIAKFTGGKRKTQRRRLNKRKQSRKH